MIQTCGAPALRVVQLDSHILDNEIQKYFEQQLNALVSNLPLSFSIFWQRHADEVRLGLSGVFWLYRALKGCSPGQQMMDIAYRRYSKRVIAFHFILSVVFPYMAQKLVDRTTDPDRKRLIEKLLGFSKMLEFVHHLNFLRAGGYSSIFERLLRLKAEYKNPPTLGVISFTTLNRELLWHSYRDLLLLALPLGQTARQLWTRWRTRRALRDQNDDVQSAVLKLDMKPFFPLMCTRCDKSAVVPVCNEYADLSRECGHVFCLYCYDSNFECPKCGYWLEKGKETMIRGIISHVR